MTLKIINPIKIIKIEKSNVENKRYKVTLNNGQTYNFGLDGGQTYIDHHSRRMREAYKARHYVLEQDLIDTLEPSASVFSYFLLWGPSTSLERNIKTLNKLFRMHNIH